MNLNCLRRGLVKICTMLYTIGENKIFSLINPSIPLLFPSVKSSYRKSMLDKIDVNTHIFIIYIFQSITSGLTCSGFIEWWAPLTIFTIFRHNPDRRCVFVIIRSCLWRSVAASCHKRRSDTCEATSGYDRSV